MMTENTTGDTGSLIAHSIVPHQETYYLVTRETLGSIREKSVLTDLFFLLASLAAGVYFSVSIALKTSVGLSEATKATMQTYEKVALWLSLGLVCAGIYFLVMTYRKIGAVKKSKLGVSQESK